MPGTRSQHLQFLLMVFAGWVNRRQLAIIDYLKEENRILREQLGETKPRFTADQRRRLAIKGHTLGRRTLDGQFRAGVIRGSAAPG